MNELLETCERIYYINLDKRLDRRQHIENELRHWSAKVCRVSAVEDVQSPSNGCSKSHFLVVQDAIYHNYTRIAVFEDDFQFLSPPPPAASAAAPQISFDVIQLGGRIMRDGDGDGDGLIRVYQSLTSCGLIINRRFYNVWHKWLKEAILTDIPLDMVMQKYQEQYQWYAPKIPIGKQIASYSDIEHRHVAY